jgi:hypothetical protein
MRFGSMRSMVRTNNCNARETCRSQKRRRNTTITDELSKVVGNDGGRDEICALREEHNGRSNAIERLE